MNVQVVRGWRRYSGHAADLLELNRSTLDALLAEPVHPDCGSANKISGRIAIDPTAQVSSSVIVGPVIIGPGARVVDAYVGPYTSIGPNARVEGAEIERSIVSADASITHVGGRLADSVVGCGARVFRDFSLPRVLRLQIGERAEVALP
jgi:glucose-1-phosphate thymidylyltransferase